MKKYIIISIAFALSTMGAKAQTILMGDANGDGAITVADAAAVVDVALGKSEPLTVTVGSREKFVRDNNLSGSFAVDEATKSYKNGYEYVDLGLPSGTLWCATNLGGYVPSDAGTVVESAGVSLPEGWSIPTSTHVQELTTNCTITTQGNYLKIANTAGATKYILVASSTPKLMSADGTSFNLVENTITEVHVRPVITTTISNQIGEGENNGELESKSSGLQVFE